MQKNNTVRGKIGSVIVEVEGFFVERFINLCNMNEIEIWNVKNINGANILLEVEISKYKELKKICKKTKCKMKIKNKKGLYFFLHRYRKRKVLLLSIICSFFLIIYASSLIWSIEIKGLETVDEKQVLSAMKDKGIYVGKNRTKIKTQEAVKYIRAVVPKISWISINVRGPKIEVEVKEKGEVYEVEDNTPTHIIAKKSGILTKVIAENGTRIIEKGNYINEGEIAICGIIESKKTSYVAFVKAKGMLRADIEYEDEFKTANKETIKNYDNKKYYLLGFSINGKDFMLNYLIKDKKYDITTSKYGTKIGNIDMAINFITARPYTEQIVTYSENQQKDILLKQIENKIAEMTKDNDAVFVKKNVEFIKEESSMIAKVKYVLNEDISKEKVFSNIEE